MDVGDIVAIVSAILGSGLLSTLVTKLLDYFSKKSEDKSGVSEAMRLVLKDRLRSLCVHYIEQGWIYEDELDDILAMHSCYHDKLKGNGYLDEMIRRVRNLEIHGAGV